MLATMAQKNSESAPARKRRGKAGAGGGGAATVKEPAWARKIDDPKQRALARRIPAICDLFGVDASMLGERSASGGDPALVVQGGFRKFAVGAIVFLGRELGLRWNDMHGRDQGNQQPGSTQLEPLKGIHRHTLNQFHEQFAVFVGLPPDNETPAGKPIGDLGLYVRDRFREIWTAALADAAQADLALAE